MRHEAAQVSGQLLKVQAAPPRCATVCCWWDWKGCTAVVDYHPHCLPPALSRKLPLIPLTRHQQLPVVVQWGRADGMRA